MQMRNIVRTFMWLAIITITLTTQSSKQTTALTTTTTTTTTPSQIIQAIPFQDFQFSPNHVCTNPQYFVTSGENQDKETDRYFKMRNVPGDGDCMFLAVALAAATSMGLGGNDQLLRAISRETREIVAEVLSSKGKLYIGKDNIVDTSRLLESAVTQEPSVNTTDDYLAALKKEGCNGGLHGGGPELVALSNVLRRPISIYEVDECRLKEQESQGENDVSDEASSEVLFPIVCKGSFGEGVFEDPCLTSIPDSVIVANMQPGAYSWRLHILVLDASPTERHACVLLPQQIYN